MKTRLTPILVMDSSTFAWAPRPIATTMMTTATPMTMPSTASAERIRFAASAEKATLNARRKNISGGFRQRRRAVVLFHALDAAVLEVDRPMRVARHDGIV